MRPELLVSTIINEIHPRLMEWLCGRDRSGEFVIRVNTFKGGVSNIKFGREETVVLPK